MLVDCLLDIDNPREVPPTPTPSTLGFKVHVLPVLVDCLLDVDNPREVLVR